jgi:hypothetical protein
LICKTAEGERKLPLEDVAAIIITIGIFRYDHRCSRRESSLMTVSWVAFPAGKSRV